MAFKTTDIFELTNRRFHRNSVTPFSGSSTSFKFYNEYDKHKIGHTSVIFLVSILKY